MKLIHCRSVRATCLMRPPRHGPLAVEPCGLLVGEVANGVAQKNLCLASICTNSADSLVIDVSMVMLPAVYRCIGVRRLDALARD
jgi:hypothetical protein